MSSFGLYLHIPFCKRKCGYCDFYSLTDLARIELYTEALCRRLREGAKLVAEDTLETVYFGGGTPSLLPPFAVARIAATLRECFDLSSCVEFSVEMNPESVSDEILSAYRAMGADRISIGMQSALDRELALIGRIHTQHDTERAVATARRCGFSSLSLDLMYGLPEQNEESFQSSLETALSLSPDHLSFYCLTLSEQTPLYAARHLLPGEDKLRGMYLNASRFLTDRGFCHYEISNAALPGKESRHNLNYWLAGEYLGVGPGAHSYLGRERFSFPEDLDAFLSPLPLNDLILVNEKLDRKDRLTEYVMLSLRLKTGLDWDRLAALSDASFCQSCKEKFAVWERHGLCRKTEKGFALTAEGFFVSNMIISELI